MTETTQDAVQDEVAQETAQETASNDLTINDLNAIKTIFDIAISRGAFKPNELVPVGQTYAKLENFLIVVAKQAEAQQAEQQGA
jgi:hypothetical protein